MPRGSASASGSRKPSTVFIRWQDLEEGNEISGDASAEFQDHGTIEIELSCDNGDDVTLIGRRE
jgi:hypothetical protein